MKLIHSFYRLRPVRIWLGACAVLGIMPGMLASEPVAWQPSTPLPLRTELETARVDGIDTYWVNVIGQGFRARWSPGGDWQINPDVSGVSLMFTQRVDEQLQMRLYIYPPSDVLSDLKEPSLLAYAASIPAQFPDKKLAVSELEFEKPPLGSLLFLDSAYRKVSYELLPKNDEGASVFVCDLIGVLGDGRIAVLRFQGTERFIRMTEADLAAELRSLMSD